jgi:egghead protein (zeste-white 4 protein)
MLFLKFYLKHLIHVFLLVVSYLLFMKIDDYYKNQNQTDPIKLYGCRKAALLYAFKLITLLPFPIILLGILGLVAYNTFPNDLELTKYTNLDPFICFRVVTRGNYPQLVAKNVKRNVNLCKKNYLAKFIVEVITDNDLSLPIDDHIRKFVVPENYNTKTGVKYKARALQYALEDSVNKLGDDDWIVHLDEETLLTKSSLVGILDFIHKNKHHIGQGAITYGKEEIVNWATTLADSMRVATDYSILRFCLKTFHRPLTSFKGSFIVCKVSTEQAVSFENGLKGSITEDAYFAIQAINHGYTFDWIEGEMLEMSPFSFFDFVQQRKRWVQGLYLLATDSNVNWNVSKVFFIYSFSVWMMMPFQILYFFSSIACPSIAISLFQLDSVIGTINLVSFLYSTMFGAVKTFNMSEQRFLLNAACIVGSLLAALYLYIAESLAIFLAIFSDKKQFYIVKKFKEEE